MRQQFAFIEVVSSAIKSFSSENNKLYMVVVTLVQRTSQNAMQEPFRSTFESTASSVTGQVTIISVPCHLFSYTFFISFVHESDIVNKYSHLTPARLEK